VLAILRKNFGLKLFSLALAIAGWAYFRFLAGPSIAAQFDESIGVPIGRTAQTATVRAFPASVRYVGDMHSLVVDSLSVTPSSVLVSGPSSILARVRAVRVDVPVPRGAQDYDAMLAPEPIAPGEDQTALDVSPNLVRVRATFVRAGT